MEQDDWVARRICVDWNRLYWGTHSLYDAGAQFLLWDRRSLWIRKGPLLSYKSHWNPDETTIHILPHWNWPDRIGEKVPVFVYTNGDSAELFINGKSQGMRKKGVIPERPENMVFNATLNSSTTAEDSSLDSLKDNDESTVWKAGTNGRGQWVTLDLHKPQQVGYLG